MLSFADAGIVDLETEQSEIPSKVLESLKETFKPEAFEELQEALPTIREISLVHRLGSSEGTKLHFRQESRGTQNLCALLEPIFSFLDVGGVVCIDELSASLHPHVARHLIDYVNQKRDHTGQLVFTSHDTTLLSSELFRRDQIWFVEKDTDGATHLYPLTDFHPRKGENFRRGYLQGRYGAIPIGGTLDFEYDQEAEANFDFSS